jgi:hypothetical protein
MRNLVVIIATSLLLGLGVSLPKARADVDIAGSVLIGSGVDTGGEPHNPYAFQIGGTVELIINGFVLGARASRAITSGDVPRDLHLRAFGGDLGWEWELAILHIGPRVGMGRISQIDEKFASFYIEPGGVAEVELGIFVLGGDVRYRFVTSDMDRNGLLIYGKLGLRF